MRRVVLIVGMLLVSLFVGALALAEVSAAPPASSVAAPAKLFVTVGVDSAGRLLFLPSQIAIPQVNITVNVTFTNNYTDPGVPHTFTIDSAEGSVVVSTGNVAPGMNVSVEFHISTMKNITFNGTSFVPEQSGLGIRFYCIPHRQANMIGEIVLAGVTEPAPEKGLLLRAYWIGMIGIVSMLAWVVISYFIIKSSSRHFTDHKEHVRKGLP